MFLAFCVVVPIGFGEAGLLGEKTLPEAVGSNDMECQIPSAWFKVQPPSSVGGCPLASRFSMCFNASSWCMRSASARIRRQRFQRPRRGHQTKARDSTTAQPARNGDMEDDTLVQVLVPRLACRGRAHPSAGGRRFGA